MSDPKVDELPHEEALGLLDALHDGELDEAEAAQVRAHVADCERCQKLEAVLGGGGIRDAVTSLPPETMPESVLPGVQRKLRMRSRGRFYGEPKKAPSPWQRKKPRLNPKPPSEYRPTRGTQWWPSVSFQRRSFSSKEVYHLPFGS